MTATPITRVFNKSKDMIGYNNTVLTNTFRLLAATFAFSIILAVVSISLVVPFINPWVTMGVSMAILYLLHKNENTGVGVTLCFALTGWLGFTLGPLLSILFAINPLVVLSSLILTAAMFVGLSFYAIASKKDFSYLSSFLTVGIFIAFAASIVALFFEVAILSLVASIAFSILSSGVILWKVSDIVNGGETNYLVATVTIFVSLYNIFVSTLNIFGYTN